MQELYAEEAEILLRIIQEIDAFIKKEQSPTAHMILGAPALFVIVSERIQALLRKDIPDPLPDDILDRCLDITDRLHYDIVGSISDSEAETLAPEIFPELRKLAAARLSDALGKGLIDDGTNPGPESIMAEGREYLGLNQENPRLCQEIR